MTSPTAGLLWELWRRHRQTLLAIAVLTIAGWAIDRQDSGTDASPLVVLLAMGAFLLLLSVFNYTESPRGLGLGQFPRRLFALPVTTLRLVAVPLIAGVASIEILYALWMVPLSRGGSASVLFVAVLLASLMVFYLAALWALERAGSLRLIALGAIAIGLFVAGMLPSFPPTPPPGWRSEVALGSIVSSLAAAAFVMAWRHVARLRSGGGRAGIRAEWVFGRIAEVMPAPRHPFANAGAALFWFEWRAAGLVLPALVAAMLLLISLALQFRSNDDSGMRLLLIAAATPIVLAVPVGIAFSRPAFWSQDVSIPAFVAVLPMRSEDLIATRVIVAAASTVLSWIVVLLFMLVWLTMVDGGDGLSLFAMQLWAFHGHSTAAVYGIAVLALLAAMIATWRLLVIRMWNGLSGVPTLVTGSVLASAVGILLIVALEGETWPAWLFDDPDRFAPLAWAAAAAVIGKYWLAAYAWRHVPMRYTRQYLLIWLLGSAVLLGFALSVWSIVRIYVPLDVERSRSVIVLLALLSVPLARIGLAASLLGRNRHRA